MYILLFSRQDAHHLNYLLADALAEPKLQNRILNHDPHLISEFTLPQTVWQVIISIQARSLEDFCQQLVKLETSS